MTVYNIYIFNREGTCLYHYEWNRRTDSNMPKHEVMYAIHGVALGSLIGIKIIRLLLLDFYSKIQTFSVWEGIVWWCIGHPPIIGGC